MLTDQEFEGLKADVAQLSCLLSAMVDCRELGTRGPSAVLVTKLAKRIRHCLSEPEEICYRT
ncbi:hypothetical protein AYO47_00315 [Planctomyces sp. SCGC AG-212-M04]|nr:hypothetical protein AYO47_00315 [Planctomyces sp. SCGC AG-212-M04]